MMGPDVEPGSALADPIAGSPVFPAGSRINERGRIEVAGCDLVELAAEFGTPAYVYSEDDLRARARQTMAAFAERTESFEVLYNRLQEVTARLESGDLSLEHSVALYEEGMRLARRCQDLLSGVEQRIEVLRQAFDDTRVPEPDFR